MSKQKAPALTASKAVGKNDFSPISGIKIPQIYSICGNSAYYATESGIKGALSAVQSGFLGKNSVVLTNCSRLATL